MSDGETLALLRPSAALGLAYLAMVDECIAAGEGYPYNNVELAREDFAAFVRELEDEAQGIGLPPDIAPQQTYVLVKDATSVVGEIRFRPTIIPPYNLRNDHIGYNIRPSARGKGYATRQLALLLDEARRQRLAGVVLHVEGENPASVRVIEKNGGQMERDEADPDTGKRVRRFWITLT